MRGTYSGLQSHCVGLAACNLNCSILDSRLQFARPIPCPNFTLSLPDLPIDKAGGELPEFGSAREVRYGQQYLKSCGSDDRRYRPLQNVKWTQTVKPLLWAPLLLSVHACVLLLLLSISLLITSPHKCSFSEGRKSPHSWQSRNELRGTLQTVGYDIILAYAHKVSPFK
jgi:hypothetical protein